MSADSAACVAARRGVPRLAAGRDRRRPLVATARGCLTVPMGLSMATRKSRVEPSIGTCFRGRQ